MDKMLIATPQASSVFSAEKPARSPRMVTLLLPEDTEQSDQNKEIVRKNRLAAELLEVLPIKYKKKMRTIIEQYQNEKIGYIKYLKSIGCEDTRRPKTPVPLLEGPLNFTPHNTSDSIKAKESAHQVPPQKTSQHQMIPLEQHERRVQALQNNLENQSHKIQSMRVQLQQAQESNFKTKSAIIQLQCALEQGQCEITRLKGEVQALNSVVVATIENNQRLEADLGHKNELLSKRLDIAMKALDEKSNLIKEYTTKINDLTEALEKSRQDVQRLTKENQMNLERQQEITKQLRQKRILEVKRSFLKDEVESVVNKMSPKPAGALDPQPFVNGLVESLQLNTLKVSCYRKLSGATTLSPSKSLKNSPAKSFRQSLRKAKESTLQHHPAHEEVSEPESADFGKEKVIQKKKIRKLLTDLLRIDKQREEVKKKIALEQLAVEIGLRQKQVDEIFDLI